MARRNHTFEIDEYYHCFNRGTDKRIIFAEKQDYSYFLRSLKAYNSYETLGKLRLHNQIPDSDTPVSILAYCLLPNHFHLVLKEKSENGISKFMQRVGIGYTMYFNEKYERSGGLFQGTFKSKHITTDQDLRQVVSYVYLNQVVHNISDSRLYRNGMSTKYTSVRVQNSNRDMEALKEVVEIIKEQRLSLD